MKVENIMHKDFKSFELFIRNIDKGDIEVLENYELIDSCVEEILNSSENALIMFLDDYRNRLNSRIKDEVFSMIDFTIISHPKLQDEYEKKYIIKSIFLNTTNSFQLLEVYRKNELLSDEFNKLHGEMESKYIDIEENNKKMIGQFVSILGIFSAVVLAFNGGFSMITSALCSLNDVSIYRITF